MPVYLSEIISFLKNIVPEHFAVSWDNSGLQVGDPVAKIFGTLLSLDLSPSVIEEAIKAPANLIITHHPVIFPSLKSIDYSTPVGKMIRELVIHDIAHFAMHTNMDRSFLSAGRVLAELIGLKGVKRYIESPHDEKNMIYTGQFEPPLPWEDVINVLKEKLDCNSIRTVGKCDRVATVAAIPGGGGSFIKELNRKFDIIITGEINYHDSLDAAGRGQAVAALGHYYSEKPAMRQLAQILKERFPDVPFHVASGEGELYRIV